MLASLRWRDSRFGFLETDSTAGVLVAELVAGGGDAVAIPTSLFSNSLLTLSLFSNSLLTNAVKTDGRSPTGGNGRSVTDGR